MIFVALHCRSLLYRLIQCLATSVCLNCHAPIKPSNTWLFWISHSIMGPTMPTGWSQWNSRSHLLSWRPSFAGAAIWVFFLYFFFLKAYFYIRLLNQYWILVYNLEINIWPHGYGDTIINPSSIMWGVYTVTFF